MYTVVAFTGKLPRLVFPAVMKVAALMNNSGEESMIISPESPSQDGAEQTAKLVALYRSSHPHIPTHFVSCVLAMHWRLTF
jgi:hypothetical protein